MSPNTALLKEMSCMKAPHMALSSSDMADVPGGSFMELGFVDDTISSMKSWILLSIIYIEKSQAY